ncbi:MAG: methylenetetrahydrofolate--tRNA-(uracil(54)-C(5))-methyltransferase (FADH(2)-oxidizing) TrmFO [Bacilli bacterium]|nr:methylenetetrahydrofolate--tRNA-(uracil(54)-C(5))-methyltransferase (FADH(2)-oxidizing) TrmFO [Bacilli bacterium]
MKTINVVGAGLAGVEATYQLIKRGYRVRLFEMRPTKLTPAHQTGGFAELICSNSLRARANTNAVGLLKEEMMRLDSLVMKAALATEVPAGGALAVDRDLFSQMITSTLKSHPLVEFINEEIESIPEGPTIIATGPLSSDAISKAIQDFCGEEHLYFYDAIAPIIASSSINLDIVYRKSRYDKGEADYLNCPMTEEDFDRFYDVLIHAEAVTPKDFEMKVFEGCMAIEEMAKRGKQTLLYGPMKPVGLDNPKTGKRPYAVVQLRQENNHRSLYNLVGFQTHLKFPEQKRLCQLIPGLENCEIVRYGVMHRNTYVYGPHVLNLYYQTKKREDLFFAGQMTGVEGYIESAASGLVAGINMALTLEGKPMIDFTKETALGALQHHIGTANSTFVPMNVNFGLFDEPPALKKKDRKEAYLTRALVRIEQIRNQSL